MNHAVISHWQLTRPLQRVH